MKKIQLFIVFLSFLGCSMQQRQESLSQSGLLWKITGNGLSSPSYLFGTVHTPEAIKIIDSIPAFKSVFTSTHQFVCEILPDSSNETNPFTKKHSDKTLSFLKPWPVTDSTYANLLTDMQRSIFDSACKANKKINLIEWGNLRPFKAINFIQTIERINGHKRRPNKVIANSLPDPYNDSLKIYFLDYYLLNQAKSHKMETFGLETIEERQIIYNSIPQYIPQLSYRTEMDLFIYYLENYKKIDSLNNEYKSKLMSQYFNQKLDSMTIQKRGINTNIELVNWWLEYDDSEIMQDFLIDKRNELWMQRIPKFIQNKSSFIAVGAGHLGGEKGLINQLRKLNYTVVSIEKTINN